MFANTAAEMFLGIQYYIPFPSPSLFLRSVLFVVYAPAEVTMFLSADISRNRLGASLTANKRGRQKKCVRIFLNFTYPYKAQPGQKTAGNFPDFFEGIYSLDVWVSKFGCLFEYLTVSRSYGLSKTDEAINHKQ